MKCLIGLFIYCISVSPVMAQELLSTWDNPAAGMAGWEKGTMNTFTEYLETGGNPGGHIRAYGNLTTGIINRQPEFTGNYLQKNYNNISLDILVNMQQLANFKPAIQIRYSPSFAGWNYELSNFTTNAGVWQHFSVYFDPEWSDAEALTNGWTLSPGPSRTFQETMAHVGSISILSHYPQMTSKNLGFDNFMLSHVEAPPQEPQPEETAPPSDTSQQEGASSPEESSRPEEIQQPPETSSQEASPTDENQEQPPTRKVLRPLKIRPGITRPDRTIKRKTE